VAPGELAQKKKKNGATYPATEKNKANAAQKTPIRVGKKKNHEGSVSNKKARASKQGKVSRVGQEGGQMDELSGAVKKLRAKQKRNHRTN